MVKTINQNKVKLILVNTRDISYIITNMRKSDRQEIFCQYPNEDDTLNAKILQNAVMNAGSHSRVVTVKGQPVLAFGMIEVSPKRFKAWAFATDKAARAFPAATRFMNNELIPFLQKNANRIEAESISTHKSAHKWLSALGAKPVLKLAKVGKNGEDFILFERVF